jgi:hypothetical protein
MGNLHRLIHTWLGEEIGPESYADDVFLGYWWRRIGSEVWILEYSSSSAAIFSFSRNRASLRTAGMFLSEMNDHVSQFESDVTTSFISERIQLPTNNHRGLFVQIKPN